MVKIFISNSTQPRTLVDTQNKFAVVVAFKPISNMIGESTDVLLGTFDTRQAALEFWKTRSSQIQSNIDSSNEQVVACLKLYSPGGTPLIDEFERVQQRWIFDQMSNLISRQPVSVH